MNTIDLIATLLLHSVWILALAALLVRASDAVVPSRWRHGLACLGIAGAVVALACLGWSMTRDPAAQMIQANVAAVTAATPMPSSWLPTATTAPGANVITPTAMASGAWSWNAITVVIWLLGVLAIGGWHGLAWLRIRRICRRSAPMPASFDALLSDCLGSMRLSTRIRIRVTTASIGWCVIGWVRPVVLVPATLLNLPQDQFRALLLHELAHVRRHDWLINGALVICETLWFFHPAMWWLGRRIRKEREALCDQVAVHQGADPEAFAYGLMAVLRSARPQAALSLSAGDGDAASRIRALLDEAPAQRSRRSAWIAALGAVFLAAGVVACSSREALPSLESEVIPAQSLPASASATRPAVARARLIAALNSPKQIRAEIQTGLMPIEKLPMNLRHGGVAVIDAAQAARVIAALPKRQEQSITMLPLQSAYAAVLNHQEYSSDLRRVSEKGLEMEKIVDVLKFGRVISLSLDADVAGGVHVEHLDVHHSHIRGFDTWRVTGLNGITEGIEEPVIERRCAKTSSIQIPESRSLLLVSAMPTIESRSSNGRQHLPSTRIGASIDTDPARDPRVLVAVVTGTILNAGAQERLHIKQRELLSALDIHLNMEFRDVSIAQLFDAVSRQSGMAVKITDSNESAQRISFTCHGMAFEEALNAILRQTTLQAVLSPDGLVLSPMRAQDVVAPEFLPVADDVPISVFYQLDELIDRIIATRVPKPVSETDILNAFLAAFAAATPQEMTTYAKAHATLIGKAVRLFGPRARQEEFQRVIEAMRRGPVESITNPASSAVVAATRSARAHTVPGATVSLASLAESVKMLLHGGQTEEPGHTVTIQDNVLTVTGTAERRETAWIETLEALRNHYAQQGQAHLETVKAMQQMIEIEKQKLEQKLKQALDDGASP